MSDQDLRENDLFNSPNFLNSLKLELNKISSINLENLNSIKAFPVYVSSGFTNISKKNIFLSGDALFTFPPSFAQGASQSIETAQDIFDCIINRSYNSYKNRFRKISSINLRSKINNFASL